MKDKFQKDIRVGHIICHAIASGSSSVNIKIGIVVKVSEKSVKFLSHGRWGVTSTKITTLTATGNSIIIGHVNGPAWAILPQLIRDEFEGMEQAVPFHFNGETT
jgi:hypothetical protein